jgi:hypothetical protein
MTERECLERKGLNMNKTLIGVIGTVLVIVFLVWLFGGTSLSCHESFWNKDKTVIEINKK